MTPYAIVIESRTGNTALLGQRLQDVLPKENCLYVGKPSEEALAAPVLFVGFWTDKGQADAVTLEFLRKLHGKTVYLFGTAGFGISEKYFQSIIGRTQAALAEDNMLAASFMCQGKMPLAVRERYEKNLLEQPLNDKLREMIANFDQALSHPDAQDLADLTQWAQNLTM